MDNKQVVKKGAGTPSQRFSEMVVREYGAAVDSGIKMTEYQKKLAQHIFIKVDIALKEAEKKRNNAKNNTPIVWQNVNIQKLSIDAVHRVELGLDALVSNHIWPIPYKNSRTGLYDIDLRIGYEGKNYYHRQRSLYPIVDIIYELVYSEDKFEVIKKGINNNIEHYVFEIKSPFERGEVVGGFGYIIYEDNTKNKLVILTNDDFLKAKNSAMSKDFWEKFPEEMKYKTILHRVTKHIVVDPEKINKSFFMVENDDSDYSGKHEIDFKTEVSENANQEVIDITPVDNKPEELTEKEKSEIEKQEMEESKQEEGPKF